MSMEIVKKELKRDGLMDKTNKLFHLSSDDCGVS